jgi:hypothetical protein
MELMAITIHNQDDADDDDADGEMRHVPSMGMFKRAVDIAARRHNGVTAPEGI